MTVTGQAAAWRFAIAGMSAAGAASFALFAIGQPLWLLSAGAPVVPHSAVMAWSAPLAGLPMGALAYFAAVVAMGAPSGQAQWEAVVRRSLAMGLGGLGLGAIWAGVALAAALAMYGRSTIHLAGESIVIPMIVILTGLAMVVAVNLIRMRAGGVWTALGHVLWGFMGVVALTISAPMIIDAVRIDDGRTLSQRYNLLIVFYPILWLAFAAFATTVLICGVRWLRFGLSAHPNHQTVAQSVDAARPVANEETGEIRNKAA